RVLPITSRASIAAWASAAFSSGKVRPTTGAIRPAAASDIARSVIWRRSAGANCTCSIPRTITRRRAASSGSIAVNPPLGAPCAGPDGRSADEASRARAAGKAGARAAQPHPAGARDDRIAGHDAPLDVPAVAAALTRVRDDPPPDPIGNHAVADGAHDSGNT